MKKMNKKIQKNPVVMFYIGLIIGIIIAAIITFEIMKDDQEVTVPICDEGMKRCNPNLDGIIQLCENNKWVDTEDKSDFCIPTDCKATDFKQIIFAHSLSCPHCQNMIPIIKELEEEGYNFFWATSGTMEGKQIGDCYTDVMTGYVPQFICSSNKETVGGAMPKENLVAWINEKCGG